MNSRKEKTREREREKPSRITERDNHIQTQTRNANRRREIRRVTVDISQSQDPFESRQTSNTIAEETIPPKSNARSAPWIPHILRRQCRGQNRSCHIGPSHVPPHQTNSPRLGAMKTGNRTEVGVRSHVKVSDSEKMIGQFPAIFEDISPVIVPRSGLLLYLMC